MEQIEKFEDYVDGRLQQLEAEIKAYKQLKLDLNVPAIKGGASVVSFKMSNDSFSKPDDWPKKLLDKIARVILIENRAIKFSEIINRFSEIEGERSAKKIKQSLSTTLTNLVQKGIVEGCQFNSDKRLTYYVKPEWVTEEDGVRKIKPEFYPSAESIEGLSEEQLNPKNIAWKRKLVSIHY